MATFSLRGQVLWSTCSFKSKISYSAKNLNLISFRFAFLLPFILILTFSKARGQERNDFLPEIDHILPEKVDKGSKTVSDNTIDKGGSKTTTMRELIYHSPNGDVKGKGIEKRIEYKDSHGYLMRTDI